VNQQYLPDALIGTNYYQPTEFGAEKNLASQLLERKNQRDKQ
jgi:replication-associated recombination protein RarA